MDFEARAKQIVLEYAINHCDVTDRVLSVDVYTVWKCKCLQNWKFLISTNLPDGMYYEVTYNGDEQDWYLDAYKKFENKCIHEDGVV